MEAAGIEPRTSQPPTDSVNHHGHTGYLTTNGFSRRVNFLVIFLPLFKNIYSNSSEASFYPKMQHQLPSGRDKRKKVIPNIFSVQSCFSDFS